MLKPKNVKFVSGNKQLYEQFEKHHVIGVGNSFVYEVISQQGQSQCVKQIILQDKMNEFIFLKEIQLLNKLKSNPHPNIVDFKGSYTLIEKKIQGKTVKKGYIQMEKGLTNLKAYLSHRKKPFDEEDVTSFFFSMIDAFAHLQKIQVAHRDIKPSNILVFDESPLFFKVCDVGAGTAVGECDNTKERTVIGTPYYLSPQLYQAFLQKMNLINYKAYKSDVYSLGLLFIQFCLFKKISERLKNQPFQVQQRIKQVKQKYPNIIGLGKILRNMLQFQVSKRMDFLQLKVYVQQNNLLRNKFDKTLTLSPQLDHKLASQQQIYIEGIQQLNQLNAIVSTKSRINFLKIKIQPNINPLKQNQKDLLNQLSKIRHMKLNQLYIDIQVCEVQDKHLKLIADALQKNIDLKKLSLNFWNNQITNQSFIQLMKSITKNLPALEHLTLFFPSNNLRIDENYKGIFNFQAMSNLNVLELNFSFNNFTSDGLICLTKDISDSCKFLETLSITIQSIKTNPIHFAKAMKNFMNLSMIKELKMNASSNSIRDQGMFALSDVIKKWERLQKCELILRSCEIQDKGFGQFMKELSQRNELKDLKLNLLSNQLSQKGTNSFSKHFETLSALKSIDLNISNNPNFNDAAVRLLSKSILMIKGIVKMRLYLDSIDLTEKGCLYLGRLISQEPSLEELQLSLKHDNIKLTGIQYICAGLLKVKRIRKLKVCFEATNIGDESANYLAMCLLKMRHLTNVELNLDNCNLTGQTVQNIIKTVKQCSKKTQEITINLRRNHQLKLELYQQIKKDLNGSRIAIRLDNPSEIQYSPLLKNSIDPTKSF